MSITLIKTLFFWQLLFPLSYIIYSIIIGLEPIAYRFLKIYLLFVFFLRLPPAGLEPTILWSVAIRVIQLHHKGINYSKIITCAGTSKRKLVVKVIISQ